MNWDDSSGMAKLLQSLSFFFGMEEELVLQSYVFWFIG